MQAIQLSRCILEFIKDVHNLQGEFPSEILSADYHWDGYWEVVVDMRKLDIINETEEFWSKHPDRYWEFVKDWYFMRECFEASIRGTSGGDKEDHFYQGRPRMALRITMDNHSEDTHDLEFLDGLRVCFKHLEKELGACLRIAKEKEDDED